MRGEHRGRQSAKSLQTGSSPHARGTPAFVFDADGAVGIIPACAGNTIRSAAAWPAVWDHPRMRGEHASDCDPCDWDVGSSPHARGTLETLIRENKGDGIIPACAGNTWSATLPAPTVWDHPRMRGEHRLGSPFRPDVPGSSPHARGTRLIEMFVQLFRGIIPACAGNTFTPPTFHTAQRDHPRMRGEHDYTAKAVADYVGSSPHARGTPADQRDSIGTVGIIPACAGNTWRSSLRRFATGDHPRMRGEHFGEICVRVRAQGSSPHARGTRVHACASAGDAGIIPACAGNTFLFRLDLIVDGDHPRMRGEHLPDVMTVAIKTGSSPHARGTPVRVRVQEPVGGIIPACAGNTRDEFTGVLIQRDHPRMRGEHFSMALLSMPRKGSSPHARGTHVEGDVGDAVSGIIPACAGNTCLTS